jgi:uncharacterized protein
VVERVIVVSGLGSSDAAPDGVLVRLAVSATADEPAAALAACGAAQDAVVAALPGLPVRPGPVSVEPEWDHERQRPGRPRAVSALSVLLPDVAGAGEAVGAALVAGGTAVALQSLVPVLSDDADARERARAAAFADARRTAEHLAGLAGCGLGPVVSVREGGGGPDVRVARVLRAEADAGFALPEGPVGVDAVLTVTWELTGG